MTVHTVFIYMKHSFFKIITVCFVLAGILSAAAQEIEIKAVRSGKVYKIEAVFFVKTDTETVKKVLTDYENIQNISSAITLSRIKEKRADGVVFEQIGKERLFFLFPVKIHLLLDVQEKGNEIIFKDLLKKNFKVYYGSWVIVPMDKKTKVTYTLFAKTSFFVPPFVEKSVLKRKGKKLCGEILTAIENFGKKD